MNSIELVNVLLDAGSFALMHLTAASVLYKEHNPTSSWVEALYHGPKAYVTGLCSGIKECCYFKRKN